MRRLFSHRLLPSCKDRRLLESLLSSIIFINSHNVRYISNGTNKRTDTINFELLFSSCTNYKVAKCIHALLLTSGKSQSKYIATRLVNIYAHLHDISSSRQTFNQIPGKDTYTWNSMISAYVRNGHFSQAVNCVYIMLSTPDVRPDHYTFPPVLKACNSILDGTRLHCWTLKTGFEWDMFVAASLVHMYCRFGFSDAAHHIFMSMPVRDMACWNSVISGFCQNGNGKEALSIIGEMRLEGISMDSVTIATILPICVQINDILHGMVIHLYAIKHGLESEVFVANALINMYAKFGKLEIAQNIFDWMDVRDLVSWNSIIAAYEQNDYPHDAVHYFHLMGQNRVKPDVLTLISLSSSIAQTKDSWSGKCVHGFIIKRDWITKDRVIGNAVVDMYSKLGIMDSARRIFEDLHSKDVISWNTMIAGYGQNGFAGEAVETYRNMKKCYDLTPNEGTWVCVLPAYAHLGALRDGMKVHGHVLKAGIDSDLYVATCLIDLYGKCGRLSEALSLFYGVSRETPATWSAIISCHGLYGLGARCLKLFNHMLEEGVTPDKVTFLALLSACSHSGLVDQGKWCFDLMQQNYGIRPNLQHYGCMVDLLGRAGKLEEAYNFIKEMPLKPDATIWGALLGACRIHGNVEMGKLASNHLFGLNSGDAGHYVLLSNIYANFGRWENVDEVRSLVRDKGLRKTPGWSSIELNNKTKVFYSGNTQFDEIVKELVILNAKLKGIGYVPDCSYVLQDIEDDEKENILMGHSERLAIMYGILNTPHKTSIRIYKNLRVCGDCHNITKFMSKLTEREIVVRDSNRFHHFKDGSCSCGDYW